MSVEILVRKKSMARITKQANILFCGPRIRVKQEKECCIIEIKAKIKTTKK